MVKYDKKKGDSKMKSIYFFCSRLWVYLTEIPVIFMLWIALSYNSNSDEIFKFYPLIIFLCLSIVFIMVYFFRVISISTDEIRFHGVFSSRDSAFIKEHETLTITYYGKKRLRFELYGDAGDEPAFDWMKAEDVIHRDICLFRGRAIGGKMGIVKVFEFFSVPCPDNALDDGFKFENELIAISVESNDDMTRAKIKFKKKQQLYSCFLLNSVL